MAMSPDTETMVATTTAPTEPAAPAQPDHAPMTLPVIPGEHPNEAPRLVPVEVVPGVTGVSGCSTRANLPLTWGDDTLSVLPGTLSEETLVDRLRRTDAAVIMKVGRNLGKVRRAVEAAGLLSRAVYVERGTMEDERILPLAECE